MKDVPAIIQPLKITLFLTLISSTVWGASGTLQTVNEVSGTGHVSGFYNKADSEFGNGGLQITFSGLTSSAFHSVIFSKDGGPTTAIAEKFYFESGLVTNGIISTGSGETTATIEIRHSQLTAAPYSMSDGNTIRIGLDDNGTSTTPDFWCTITGGGNDLTYDITPPSVTSISDAYIQSGQTTTLSGSGFTDNGNATAVKAGSNSLSFSVDSDASITITGGTGDYTGSVTVTDAAGNTSTAGSVTYTLDNTAPVVSSVDEEAIKQNGTAVITGTGFLTSPASPIASITIGGSTPAGLSFNTDSDTKITITAGSGEASYSSIKVKDEADNESTATTIKIAIDNTAPTISSVSPPIAKDGTTVTISGSGFTNTGISTDPTVSIGGSDLGSLTGYSITSVTNTEIQFTVGTTEVSNGAVVVTDVAGNASGGASKLTVDNTKPTVTAVATRYIRSGQTSVVSGTGFQDDGGDAASVKVGGSTPAGMSFSVDSPTQITITAGSGEVTDGNVVVVDAAGNESTDLNKLLTIDNTAPTVSSLGSSDPDIIKEGSTITVTGTGFNSGSPITDGTGSASITVGGSTPTGLSWAVNSNTQITITAGSGEASGNVVVTDAAGNSSIETGKTLTIDNTAPVINSITPETSSQTVLKKGDTATLSGSGFTNVGIAGSDATVKLGDTDFTTYGTVSVDNDGQITLTVDPNSTANVQGNLKVTDFAGNVTTFSSNTFYIDNTAPTITSVSPPAIKNGSTSTITGTGFKTGTLESTLLVGGTTPTGMTYTVDSGTQITITAGTGETSDQQIVITDPAGNASTDDKRLTIDNSAPSVTTVGTASIKDGSTSVITGSGFFTTVDGTTDGTGVTVTVGGSTPAGMTHVVSSNTQITITAGSGEVTEGNVVVTDRAGNSSTETGKLLTIDNTAPVITSVSPSAIKSGATATVSGTGFKVGGIPSSVKVGGSVPTGMDTSSITNTSLVITAGSGEVTNGQIVITDAAGNASTSAVFLTIDNTPPDVTTVSPSVVKSGDDFTITGSGFTVGGDASAVEVGGGVPTGLSFSVDSDTKITGTAGSGEVTGGNVTVTDAAGNESTDTGKLLTIDNTAPTLSSISDRWIKNGESTTLTGSGFATNGNATQVTVGGSTPTGLSFAVNSDTKITITGGTGEVTRGTVVVYDTVGNPSTETNVKLSVDNTAPAAPT
ncbi:MAG: beta strand repeat-containing protein, partial [Fidelibacterota bacterium]